MATAKSILLEIHGERVRQIVVEGWTPEHDDDHTAGQLAKAAACYAHPGVLQFCWPWRRWWKPTTPRRNLIKAAALIVAEIERIDRAVS